MSITESDQEGSEGLKIAYILDDRNEIELFDSDTEEWKRYELTKTDCPNESPLVNAESPGAFKEARLSRMGKFDKRYIKLMESQVDVNGSVVFVVDGVIWRTVEIPGSVQHEGNDRITVKIPWKCPICGGPRGIPKRGLSYDGSRRMVVHQWENPCGHVDNYTNVRAEAANCQQH